jgi:hypothetical protein
MQGEGVVSKDDIIQQLLTMCRSYETTIKQTLEREAILLALLQRETYLKQGRKMQ